MQRTGEGREGRQGIFRQYFRRFDSCFPAFATSPSSAATVCTTELSKQLFPAAHAPFSTCSGRQRRTCTKDPSQRYVTPLEYFLADSSDDSLAVRNVKTLENEHPRWIARAAARREQLAGMMIAVQTSILRMPADESAAFWAPSNSSSLVLQSTPLTVAELLDAVSCYGGGEIGATAACECPGGRWGLLCEPGCDAMTLLGDDDASASLIPSCEKGSYLLFGGELSTSPLGLPLPYLNHITCSWLLRVLSSPATGLLISMPSLSTEVADVFSIDPCGKTNRRYLAL